MIQGSKENRIGHIRGEFSVSGMAEPYRGLLKRIERAVERAKDTGIDGAWLARLSEIADSTGIYHPDLPTAGSAWLLILPALGASFEWDPFATPPPGCPGSSAHLVAGSEEREHIAEILSRLALQLEDLPRDPQSPSTREEG